MNLAYLKILQAENDRAVVEIKQLINVETQPHHDAAVRALVIYTARQKYEPKQTRTKVAYFVANKLQWSQIAD